MSNLTYKSENGTYEIYVEWLNRADHHGYAMREPFHTDIEPTVEVKLRHKIANVLMEHYAVLIQLKIVEILDEEIVKEVGGEKLIGYLLNKELEPFINDLREGDDYCHFVAPTFRHGTCCVVGLSSDTIDYYRDFE